MPEANQAAAPETAADTAQSSVPVKYWDCYHSELPTVDTHQMDVTDHRKGSGQMFVDIGAIEGNLDDMLSVTAEINTNPLNGIDHVPCVHVHLDGDSLAFSMFKVGDKILIRPETDVRIAPVHEQVNGVNEILYWVE